ncbi:hypothetical protein V525_01310 [Gordonia alkanivorans CGMCC 6845]|uniref:Uncharacterized protein n=1 Tax=Gordonia alkanivorans CGMCC 6845 TaxID=1423140 RepID=W9DJW9_9ACTN|nr:hypothetical protein V525_01310 [Gordonia alkanivorans CGMCC 6845]
MILYWRFTLNIYRFQPLGGHAQYTFRNADEEFDSA